LTFIEFVLRLYIRQKRRAYSHAEDLNRINGAADQLNSEAADALEY